MPRVLIIDDDRIIRKVIEANLSSLGYEVAAAADGPEGLQRAAETRPDLIITDIMMPGLDGFEVTRRLRRDPALARVPVLVLTGDVALQDRLQAFAAGADDYLSKPFEMSELARRLEKLLQRAESARSGERPSSSPRPLRSRLVAVHSLRGGVGATSLAVNLAVALAGLWPEPTVVWDLAPPAGQVALMLNVPLKRSWADAANPSPAGPVADRLPDIVIRHDSGLRVIAAPASPLPDVGLSHDLVRRACELLRSQYAYTVADLPHDFSQVARDFLDGADVILLPLAPDLISVRAAAVALDTYVQLGYRADGVRLILSETLGHGGLTQREIERALQHDIALRVPYAPERFVTALNRGRPLLLAFPDDDVTALLEDFAFRISHPRHRDQPPPDPSAMWRRVNRRRQQFPSRSADESTGAASRSP